MFLSDIWKHGEDEGSEAHEEKRRALDLLNEAFAEAREEGIDGDCVAQVALFAAFSELVSTYGEDAVGEYVETLARKVRDGAYTIGLRH